MRYTKFVSRPLVWLAAFCLLPASLVALTTADIPFTITLRNIPVTGWNGSHSFAFANYHDLVIIVGGRTNGLHNFPASLRDENQAFPRSRANDQIILLNPANGTVVAQKSVNDLPKPINLHLRSTNAQSHSEDGWLYYVGGYGDDPDNPTMVTMPYVTAINLDELVKTLREPQGRLDADFASKYIGFAENFNAAKVAGGDMQPVFDTTSGQRVEDAYFIVFGQVFNGMYFASGAAAYQQYRNRVQMVYIKAVQGTENGSPKVTLTTQDLGSNPASIQDAENFPPDNPYHRRDLTVAPSFRPGGGMAVTAYGGVFKNDLGGYLEPIYIQNHYGSLITLHEDINAKQVLSHYKCPVIQMYDDDTNTMYSTFFAGISHYYWDSAQQKLIHDPPEIAKGIDGLPFIDSVSTLVSTAGGGKTSTAQYLFNNLTFPPADDPFDCNGAPVKFLGSETHLVPKDNGLPRFANNVIDYAKWKKIRAHSFVVGYLIGGIASTKSYAAGQPENTCAANRIYEVTVTLTPQEVTRLPIPAD